MRYEVWHRQAPTFGENNPRLLQLDFPKGFVLVAVVDVADEHAVFTVTNHVQHAWTTNPEVVELPRGVGQRSTSVGDVIVEQDTLRAWTVDRIGLTQFEG